MKASRTAFAAQRIAAIRDELGEGALRLAYLAAVPVVVDATLLNLLRVNFFLDPPDALPYEAEADLLLSPLFRDIGDGLYEIDPDIRNLLLTGLHSRYEDAWIRRVAVLLEQYTDATVSWHSLPELERAQQLTAVSLLDPARAALWLESNASGMSGEDLEREWYVAMRRRIADQSSVTTVDEEIARTTERLHSWNVQIRIDAVHNLAGLACLPETDIAQVVAALINFVHIVSQDSGEPVSPDVQAALSLVGNLPHDGFELANVTLIGAELAGLDFTGVKFTNVSLYDVDAVGINLTSAIFRNVLLQNVRMNKALLDGADLQFTELSHVSFANASLDGTSLVARVAQDVDIENVSTASSAIDLHGSSVKNSLDIPEDDVGNTGHGISMDAVLPGRSSPSGQSNEEPVDIVTLLGHAKSFEDGGDWEAARAAYREIIDHADEASDPDAFAGIGRADAHLGVLDSAEEWYGRALEFYRQARKEQQVAETLISLGVLAEDTGRLEVAIERFSEAREILTPVDDPLGFGRAEASLGRVRAKLAMPYQAANHYQRALDLFTKSGAIGNEAEVLLPLTDVMINLGRLSEAALYAGRGTQVSRDLGSNSLEISCQVKLAQIYRAQGNPGEALAACEKALWASARTLGANHADTLTIASEVASLWHETGNLSAALLVDEYTFDMRRMVLGRDHPDTLYSARRFAAALRELGEIQEARSLDEDTLERYRTLLGDSHRDTQALADELTLETANVDSSSVSGSLQALSAEFAHEQSASAYLCYLLDASGARVGTCFRVSPGVLLASWNELRQIGLVSSGSIVRISPASIDSWFSARVVRVDQVRDLAVLVTGVSNTDVSERSVQSAPSWLSHFVASSLMIQGEAVQVIGLGQANVYNRRNVALVTSGEWAGSSTRDQTPVGVVFCRSTILGTSSLPVIREQDGAVAGIMLGRSNLSQAGSHTIYIVRGEDLIELLDGIAEVTLDGPHVGG